MRDYNRANKNKVAENKVLSFFNNEQVAESMGN